MPAALAAMLAGCASEAPGQVNTPPDDVDDEAPPLASLEELLAGAPAQGELPYRPRAEVVLPPKFDLVAEQSPVKHQGKRGTCSIFSTVGLMEHLYIQAGYPQPDFSEQYLQWSTKFQVGAFPDSSGSNAYYNLWAINEYGIPAEVAWPYESVQWNQSNDPACVGEEQNQPTRCFTNGAPSEAALAAPRFFLPWGRYIQADAIKDHIVTEKTAVIVSMEIFYQAWNHGASTIPVSREYWYQGIVSNPRAKDIEESRKQQAGHSILIVGWDDELELQSRDDNAQLAFDAAGNPIMEKGFYIFKNSWGTASFGRENAYGPGYGYLSMRYVHDHGSAFVTTRPTLTP